MDVAVPADHKVKLKEKKKEKDSYFEHEGTIIQIVIGVLGTVIKGILKGLEDLEIRGRVETILTTTLLNTERSPRDLWKIAPTQTYERPLANADEKKL